MSLPATWLALPHVGTSGNQGPHTAACTDPQIRILLRRRQFEHRSVRAHDMPHLQCHDLPEFSQATAAPTNAWTPNDRRTRQCPLSSRKTPGPFSTSPYPTPAAAVPTALQSATGPYRAGLETDTAPRDAQPLLRNAPRRLEGRQRVFRPVASAERSVEKIMLHYLRRCV